VTSDPRLVSPSPAHKPARPLPDPAPADAPSHRTKAPRPDATCPGCGTSIPAEDQLCAFCYLQDAPPTVSRRDLLVHWLVFLAAMGLVFGGGYLLAH